MSAIGHSWGAGGAGGASGSGHVTRTLSAQTLKLDSTPLDEVALQKLLRMERFMQYLIQADSRIGDLWDAFAVAERLEK